MQWKRTLTFVAVGGAAIAWFAGAATSNREIPPPVIATHQPVDAQSADLAKEIARLHDRLRPDATPRQPGRNLFAFRAAPQPVAPQPSVAPALSEPVAPVRPPQPPMQLAGIAQDDGPDGAVRTAIVSSGGQVFLVKPGDAVTTRYRVARVGEDVVELTDTIDGSIRRLALK